MAELIVENIKADSVETTELNTGNMIVKGKARFVQPIYTSGIEGSQDINQVGTGTLQDSHYVMCSNGTNLYRVQYSTFVNDVYDKVIADISDSEGVPY